MAGKKGQSGPPGNANAFRHGLATVQSRRANGALTVEEQDIRADILAGLIADKGGKQQIGTASASWPRSSAAMWRYWSLSTKPSTASSKQPENPAKPKGTSTARRLQARVGEQSDRKSSTLRLWKDGEGRNASRDNRRDGREAC
jgi:hypothetical protein